jgi:hypothetical protein
MFATSKMPSMGRAIRGFSSWELFTKGPTERYHKLRERDQAMAKEKEESLKDTKDSKDTESTANRSELL